MQRPNMTINPANYNKVVIKFEPETTITEKQDFLLRYEALPLTDTVDMTWQRMALWVPKEHSLDMLNSESVVYIAEDVVERWTY